MLTERCWGVVDQHGHRVEGKEFYAKVPGFPIWVSGFWGRGLHFRYTMSPQAPPNGVQGLVGTSHDRMCQEGHLSRVRVSNFQLGTAYKSGTRRNPDEARTLDCSSPSSHLPLGQPGDEPDSTLGTFYLSYLRSYQVETNHSQGLDKLWQLDSAPQTLACPLKRVHCPKRRGHLCLLCLLGTALDSIKKQMSFLGVTEIIGP